ncbi:MAG: hypothetical protein AABW64_01645 [Nanoarchaeota archaeon]
MKKKIAIKLAIIGAVLFALSISVYAFIVLVVVNVLPPGNCAETDRGLNFFQAGSISGTFQAPGMNVTNATFVDTCISTTALIEFVCGGSVAQQYNNLAAAVYEDCNVFSNSTKRFQCINGRCI